MALTSEPRLYTCACSRYLRGKPFATAGPVLSASLGANRFIVFTSFLGGQEPDGMSVIAILPQTRARQICCRQPPKSPKLTVAPDIFAESIRTKTQLEEKEMPSTPTMPMAVAERRLPYRGHRAVRRIVRSPNEAPSRRSSLSAQRWPAPQAHGDRTSRSQINKLQIRWRPPPARSSPTSCLGVIDEAESDPPRIGPRPACRTSIVAVSEAPMMAQSFAGSSLSVIEVTVESVQCSTGRMMPAKASPVEHANESRFSIGA